MPTSLPSRAHQTGGVALWLGRGVVAVFLVSLVAFCGLLVVNGPHLRAAAEAQEAQAIEEENKAFCSRFGGGPETARYAACAAGLTEIRARHLKRNVSDFMF